MFKNIPVYIDPEIWGKQYWFVIETIVISMDPSELNSKEFIYLFFYSLQNILPCPICREHYQSFFQKHDIKKSMDSKLSLFRWIHNLRNEINTHNKKKIISFSEYHEYLESTYSKFQI